GHDPPAPRRATRWAARSAWPLVVSTRRPERAGRRSCRRILSAGGHSGINREPCPRWTVPIFVLVSPVSRARLPHVRYPLHVLAITALCVACAPAKAPGKPAR